ncbi:DUF3152 domain-containing protein [Saccharopolyspora phatthalungensis]|uniref:DUF3152 domain-containing protein n=1 Tax=Saccharopolyspora phatthalungensis TaxID=664693 RepID=A0A840PSW4_9PSEU|nr:DUF3152 domain-containing protein [Saccharopolyspora phatthalungensis]MBB5153372.1 hypothetical protein [Saccharopolyspora phatthalungensis]
MGSASRRRGEPLAASWHPVAEPPPGDPEFVADADEFDAGVKPRPRRQHRRGVHSRYGWRIYAVPLLIVVSALAVFQTVRPAERGAASGLLDPITSDLPDEPIVTEAPPGQTFPPGMFSADLPPGGPIPETGARTFQVLSGTSPVIGSGHLFRYTVEIEVGVQIGNPNTEFGNLVQATLSDPRSWTNPQAGGISLQRVDATGPRPDFRVILVSQQTAREACDYHNGVPYDSSCRKGDMVYLNAARWVRGAVSFEGDIGNYQRYAINHEVGHVFGNKHVGCPVQGGLAPVMMQQSFSVSNNELHELNKIADQGTSIPADGFVCKYNAWPFPTAGTGGS